LAKEDKLTTKDSLSNKTYIRHLDLVALLEVLRESIDEFFGGNVLDGNSTTGVDGSKLNLQTSRSNDTLKSHLHIAFLSAYVNIK